MLAFRRTLLVLPKYITEIVRLKQTIDYSRVPEIIEHDLEEEFVRGSGPGGQSVNKTSNCVLLKHLPTGIVVKCHETRSQQENRKRARKILQRKLDNELNGDMSVEAQERRIAREKVLKKERRSAVRLELKKKFKEREGLD